MSARTTRRRARGARLSVLAVLQALVNHLLFGTSHRHYLLHEEVTLDGRGARRALSDAELDGVPVRTELHLLTRTGRVFDPSYVSDRAARAREAFTRFVKDLQIRAVERG